MCGRFYAAERFKDKLEELLLAAGVPPARPPYETSGQDVFPAGASTVICGKGDGLACTEMQWGFENPYRKGLVINARAESAGEKTLFKDSLERRRCVIPASGFYEWDAWKARFRFTRPDDSLILLAGIYRPERGGLRYTILTTEANRSMAPVHDRMPVMIEPSEMRPWICDPGMVPEFLGRPQAELICEQDAGQIRMDLGI